MVGITKISTAMVALVVVIVVLLYPLEGYSVGNAGGGTDFQIQGLEPSLLAAVKARLDYRLQALKLPLSSENLHAGYPHAVADIQQALAPYGYFKPVIHTKIFYRGKTWHVIGTISPGPLLKIRLLTVSLQGEGENNAVFKKLITELPLHQGDGFVSEHYEQAKQKLLATAVAAGYLSAHFVTHRVLIDRQFYSADVTLVFETGPLYYFGPISFQQTTLNDFFLRRYIPFQVGDPYSSELLLKLQSNLNNSGYFKHISINDLATKKQDQKIPIVFKLTPRPSQEYTMGMGYSTDVGLRATFGWESRYLNQFGHKFGIIGQLSQVQNSLQSTYILPGRHPDTDNYNINFAAVHRQLKQVDSRTQQLGIASVKRWKNWQSNLFLNYQLERFNYVDSTTVNTHLLTPGINLSRSQFDHPLYALHGYRINLRVQGAAKNILSSASFLQAQLQAKTIMSWDDKNRVILRADMGYTITPDPSHFPPSLLFYVGGSQSLRGYAYQALGPGRYLMAGSAEYQHRLVGNFYGALFFDLGNAVNNFPINLQQGAGIGLGWISPLGPIELTLGKALSLPGRPLRLQFSIGVNLL